MEDTGVVSMNISTGMGAAAYRVVWTFWWIVFRIFRIFDALNRTQGFHAVTRHIDHVQFYGSCRDATRINFYLKTLYRFVSEYLISSLASSKTV